MNKEEYSKYIDNIKDMSKEELQDYILQYFETLKIHHNIEDKLQQTINKQKEVLNRLKVVYTSMQFSAPENMYIFIEQMGDLLEEIE